MKIEIRADGKSMRISGYVNAVCRDSRPIITQRGKVVEQIREGVFRRALERAENINLLLNHNHDTVYATTKGGTLHLQEDSIGLRAETTVTDENLIEKARKKQLRGWSFGFYALADTIEERAENIPRRYIDDMDMFEVSLIDQKLRPCYTGTSIEQRAGDEAVVEERSMADEADVVEEQKKPVDMSKYDEVLTKLSKGEKR